MDAPGIWWHGSPNTFEQFRLPAKFSPQEQLGFGIHFGRSRDFANLYGRWLYKCRVQVRNVFSMNHIYRTGQDTAEESLVRDLYKRSRYALPIHGPEFVGSVDVAGPKRAQELLLKYGFDGVLYTAKFGERGAARGSMYVRDKTEALVCLDPSRITIEGIELSS